MTTATTRQLTPEQQRLVEDNLPLVGFVLRRNFGSVPRRWLDDLQAEGYLALVDAARRYDPARGRFSTLAVRVIWRKVRDAAFRLRTRSLPPAGDDLHEIPDPGERPGDLGYIELRAEVLQVLAELPREQRRAVYAIVFDDGSRRDVARRLGCGEYRAGRLVRDGLAALRLALTG